MLVVAASQPYGEVILVREGFPLLDEKGQEWMRFA
jgi:hypothetical protein